jgi:excinuclease ABC subunit A
MALTPDDRVMVLAPIVRGRKGEFKKEMEKLLKHGYTRARVDGELVNWMTTSSSTSARTTPSK